MVSPELILFAIQAAIKLSSKIKRAYVDSVKRKSLILPLPNFPEKVKVASALNFFEGSGKTYIELVPKIIKLQEKEKEETITEPEKEEFDALKRKYPFYYELPKVAELTKKARDDPWENEEEEDAKQYIKFYRIIRGIDIAASGKWNENEVDEKVLSNLFAVAQWSEGADPNPTALKRIAGTLIEIGVDYYTNVPGALNNNSAHSKALKGFFQAIDDTDFVNTPVESLAESLFVATIETLANNPNLVTGDDKSKLLIESVTHGIAKDAKVLMETRDDDLAAQERIAQWGQLVFRSVLDNAGNTVLANPERYLSVQAGGQSAMVTAVGSAVLNVIVDSDGLDAESVFSRATVDRMVKAAMETIVAHPELVGSDHEGIKTIVSQVAKELLQTSDLLTPEILPELISLILEKTSLNLDKVWPGDTKDPKQHLLLKATQQTMAIIASKPSETEPWRPRFTVEQALDILEFVLDEVVQNPDWILDEAGEGSSVLRSVLEATLDSLKEIPEGQRLSLNTSQAIIKSSIRAVALRSELVKKLPTADDTQAKYLITLALESVFEVVFNGTTPKAKWVLSRATVIEIVVDSVLYKLAVEGASEQNISVLKQVLLDMTAKLSNDKPFSVENLKARILQTEMTG